MIHNSSNNKNHRPETSKKRILVVGGGGYIGSALVPRLLELGYPVDVIDLFWFGCHLPKEARIIQKDVFEITKEELEVYDQVIYLAGLSNDPMAEFAPNLNFILNSGAPTYLAWLSKQAGVRRYIYANTCSVYGYGPDQLATETSPTPCEYPYGISKLQAEYSLMKISDSNFSVFSLRQGTVSGYSPRMRLDLLINTMVKTALQTHLITVQNPNIWRPILGIQDAVQSYVQCIEAPSEVSGIFNIASKNHSILEIAATIQKLAREFLETQIDLKIYNHAEYRNYQVSTKKAQLSLGFHSQNSIQSITKELFEKSPHFEDYDNPLYYNIQVFQKLLKEEKIHSYSKIGS